MSRWSRSERPDAEEYDRRFAEGERAGRDMHGEATFVAALTASGGSVFDAGCGTGRVAIELARRGFDVVGADLDAGMLAAARAKAPDLVWREADLAGAGLEEALLLEPGRRFDTIVAAGNVMIFLEPGTEGAVVANLACLLAPGGALVAGFQLDGRLPIDTYDDHCRRAGLDPVGRWATWDHRPWDEAAEYAVSVHRLAGGPGKGAGGP
ncbi:MAG TPA: methyltransferase domain-containing protein [Acidimicrobiales bacterium]|nr:methyltransferase domain-containing protein [Acidimicrobiales bacterium]